MEWQLEQFMSEKVERGRTLLAESEEHRGSTELQVGVGGRAGGRAAAVAVVSNLCPLSPTLHMRA